MRQSLYAVAGFLAIANGSLEHLRQNVRENFGENHVVHIHQDHLTEELINLLTENSADHWGSAEDHIHLRISPEAVRKLEAANVHFEDRTEEWLSEFEANFANENFMCVGDDCHKRDTQDFYGAYQQLPAIYGRAEDLVAQNSNARMISLGNSYEGRPQRAVEIGDGSKPLVFYFCNIHAREWLTPMYCIHMVEALLADGGHPLLDTFDFTVLLSANPDGYYFSYTSNSFWRKTRRPNPGSSCIGTDPNRNYDNNHCGPGTSNDPCEDDFCGPNPWTEIEVANIRDFALQNQGRLVAMNDIHAYSSLWLRPYGAIRSLPADNDTQNRCAVAAVDAIRATSGTSWRQGPVYTTIYPAAGVSVDWFYDTAGVVYSYSAELRTRSFQPNPSNIVPSNREVFAAMEASIRCVADEINVGPTVPPVPSAPIPTPLPIATPAPTDCFFFC